MVFSLITMVMKASPIGIFFLMADSFAKYGASLFTSMAYLAGTYYLACIIHVILVYGGILWISNGINPFRFIKDSMELWIYTLTTCSSVASIPVNIKVAKEKFGVPERISSFTIPLGSQMNYDGSVILYGCVIVFISQVVGHSLDIPTMLKIVGMSAILSTGGGGIPGSGIVKLFIMVEPLAYLLKSLVLLQHSIISLIWVLLPTTALVTLQAPSSYPAWKIKKLRDVTIML